MRHGIQRSSGLCLHHSAKPRLYHVTPGYAVEHGSERVQLFSVVTAKAGTQRRAMCRRPWVPAFALADTHISHDRANQPRHARESGHPGAPSADGGSAPPGFPLSRERRIRIANAVLFEMCASASAFAGMTKG